MKKIFLAVLVNTIALSYSYCQEAPTTTNEDILKVTRNHFTTELNINPFKGELSLNNAINQIKLRYFTRDDVALRLGFVVNSLKKTSNSSNPYGTNPTRLDETKKTRTLGLNIGIEKHLRGTRRLSPYLGGEFSIASKSSSHKIETYTSETNIEGGWLNTFPNNSTYEERGFTRFGLNLIAGFDFYLAKNFYFGYELGLGINNTNYSDLDITDKRTPSTTPALFAPDVKEKDFSVGPSLINGIRLGYAF